MSPQTRRWLRGAAPRARQAPSAQKDSFCFAKRRNKNAFRFPAKPLDASHPALGEAKGSSASDEPNNQKRRGKPMTQTAQHTPAPWTYAYAPWVTQDGIELPAFEIHGEGEKVCDTVEDQPIEAQEANARLIAATPELLDALQDLVERDRAEAAESGFTDDEMTWLEDARRAIAKAKGGAP
jgi:hypothetical protein